MGLRNGSFSLVRSMRPVPNIAVGEGEMQLPGGLDADECGVALSYSLLLTEKGVTPAAVAPAKSEKPSKAAKAAPAPAPKAAPAKSPPKSKAPAPAPAPTPKPAADDDDEFDCFGDDDEPEDPEAVAKAKAELEAAKAKANERLARKEANQRSLCVLEIKPWSAEQDLNALFAKIKETIQRDGLKWSEACELKEVAFGVKKICCTAVINQTMSMDSIIEEITEELFADEVQSMNMLSMSLL